MTSPAFVAYGTGDGQGTACTPGKPAGVASGDLLVIFVAVARADAVVDVPSGFTLIDAVDNGSQFVAELRAFWKIAGGSEPSTYSVSCTAGMAISAIVGAWRGVDQTTPVPTHASVSLTSSTSILCPSVTAATSDTALICFYADIDGQSTATYTPAAGMTNRILYRSSNAGVPLAVDGQSISATGATGTRTATASASHGWGAISFLIASAVVADTTAPNLSAPTGTKTGSTTASGTISTDEGAGTLYRLASANATETAATIKAASLTSAVTATGTQTVSFSGLTPNTLYYAHYVQDDAATPSVNTSTVVNSASFTTDPLPAAVLSSPAGTATGTTTASATVSTTIGSGTLYYLFSTNATETAATVKSSGASQAVSASGSQSVATTGLTASTLYYSHFVQVANSLDSNVANGSGFTTASVSAPVLTSPSSSSVGTTTATANVSTTVGSGTLYAYASANSTETLATVKASGTQKTVTATGAQSVNLTGLTPGTQYYLHFVHTGAADSGVSNSTSFTTTASSAAFNFVSPDHVLGMPDSPALRANLATHVCIYDKTSGALLATKTGQNTSSAGLPSSFTASGIAAGSYRIAIINDADVNDFAAFVMSAV